MGDRTSCTQVDYDRPVHHTQRAHGVRKMRIMAESLIQYMQPKTYQVADDYAGLAVMLQGQSALQCWESCDPSRDREESDHH